MHWKEEKKKRNKHIQEATLSISIRSSASSMNRIWTADRVYSKWGSYCGCDPNPPLGCWQLKTNSITSSRGNVSGDPSICRAVRPQYNPPGGNGVVSITFFFLAWSLTYWFVGGQNTSIQCLFSSVHNRIRDVTPFYKMHCIRTVSNDLM